MSAIITDQLRILNAKNFISAITSENNSYYSFVGLSNATDYSPNWNINPPTPKDNFDQESDYWDTMIALKRIKSNDVNQVVKKNTWASGTIYDMYRHDISINNIEKRFSQSTSLYSSNYYVINSDYRVYICLQNGTDPENPTGRPSLDEPTFTDLEPKSAGDSGDGYIWKYLYTIKPSEIIKFDTVNFIPVPKDWESSDEFAPIRNNASSSNNQLKIITITDRGVGLGTANKTYTDVPIKGDGNGAKATIVINNDSKVESITVSIGGSVYTYVTVDLEGGNVPVGTGGTSTKPTFDVIIPPKGGHGADIYRELGAYNVLIFSRIENDTENPDFIVGNKIARIGIVKNPQSYDSNSLLNLDKASAVYALKLSGIGYSSAVFDYNSRFTQTISTGTTAVGRVISYDQNTGVLKYWQDRSLVGFNTDGSQNEYPIYGINLNRFTNSVGSGGTTFITGTNLYIDSFFTGLSTSLNNRTYNLGQSFINGMSNPEVKKYSGDIIYVDNRPSITRSSNQKEDIKVILQF
ncbi:MAG: hypothetical protein ACO3UU_00010 [Minisyncoccia bacterium]